VIFAGYLIVLKEVLTKHN
jgi:hypothetical protein